MKKKTKKKIASGAIAALIFTGIIMLSLGLSWITTCGIVKLITLCFGLTFGWGISTGVWLLLMLLGWFLKSSSKK